MDAVHETSVRSNTSCAMNGHANAANDQPTNGQKGGKVEASSGCDINSLIPNGYMSAGDGK